MVLRIEKYKSKLRGKNTSKIVDDIIRYLCEKRSNDVDSFKAGKIEDFGSNVLKWGGEWGGGWCRWNEIFKEPFISPPKSPNTISRILDDLVEAGLVIKKRCQRFKEKGGSRPTFYRIADDIDPLELMTEEALIAEVHKERNSLQLFNENYAIAGEMYRELTGKDDFYKLVVEERVRRRSQISVQTGVERTPDGKVVPVIVTVSREEYEKTQPKIKNPCKPS
jgi:hypothetical protein